MPQPILNTVNNFVRPDTNPLPYNNEQASAATFGVLTGQSMENMGSALQGAGQDVAQVVNSINEQNTQRIARNADTSYAKIQQTAFYGDGQQVQGLFNMKGQQAMDAIQPTMKMLQDTRDQIQKGLPNGIAANLFNASAQERDNMLMPRVMAHISEQRDIANDRSSTDRSLQAENDGSLAWNDSNIVGANEHIVQSEAMQTAQRHGLDPDAQQAAVKEATAKYWDKVITGALYSGVPNASHIAQNMLAEQQQSVGGIYYAGLQSKIQAKIQQDTLTSERRENVIHTELTRTQEQNYGQFVAGIANHSTDLVAVTDAVAKNAISGQQAEALFEFSSRVGKTTGNPAHFNSLLAGIYQGEQTLDDVMGARDISDQERTQLIEKQQTFTKEGGNSGRADVKQAADYIKSLTGGARGVFGEMDAQSTSRVANALDDFYTQVNKMPGSGITADFLNSVKTDVSSRYRPSGPLSQIETLPTSAYMPPSLYSENKSQMSQTYIKAVGQLQKDIKSGKISKDQYLLENNKLKNINQQITLMQTPTTKTGQ